MDKRIFPIAGLTFLGTGSYISLVLSFLGIYSIISVLVSVMIPIMLFMFWLSLVAMAGAISDCMRRRDVTDESFFTRVFIYKAVCIPFFSINFAFWLMLSLGAANPFLFWIYIFVPGAMLFAFILMLASSYQVIAGLVWKMRKGEMKKVEFALHLVLQHIFVVDVFDAFFLMMREKKLRSKVKNRLFSRALAPRAMPAPGLMGAHVIFAIFCITVFSLNAIVVNSALSEVPITLLDMIGSWLFLFPWFSGLMIALCLLIGSGIYDAVRFQRAIPLEVREKSFLRRLLFFSSSAFVLEIISAFLIVLIPLYLYFPSYPLETDIDPTMSWFAVTVLISLFVLLQLSAFFYTRLVVKRSLADAVITCEEAKRLTIASIFPGAQILSVIILMRQVARKHDLYDDVASESIPSDVV